MEKLTELKIQKCSDGNRNYIIVEIIDGNNDTLADIAVNEDTKKVEINFYKSLSDKTVDLDKFEELLTKAKSLVYEDLKQPFPTGLENELKK